MGHEKKGRLIEPPPWCFSCVGALLVVAERRARGTRRAGRPVLTAIASDAAVRAALARAGAAAPIARSSARPVAATAIAARAAVVSATAPVVSTASAAA